MKIKSNKLDVHQVPNNVGVPGVSLKVQTKYRKFKILRKKISSGNIVFARIIVMISNIKRSVAAAFQFKIGAPQMS